MIQVPTVAGVLAAMPAEAALRTTVQNIRDVLDVIHAHPKLDPDRDPIVDLVSTIENPDPGEPSFPVERRAGLTPRPVAVAYAPDADVTACERRVQNFSVGIEPAREPDFIDEKRIIISYNGRQEYTTTLAPHEARQVFDVLANAFGFERSVHFAGIDPLNIGAGAVHPIIPASWRFGFYTTDHGLRFGYRDDGPLVAWDAVAGPLERVSDARQSMRDIIGLLDDTGVVLFDKDGRSLRALMQSVVDDGAGACVPVPVNTAPDLTPDHVAGLRHAMGFMEEYPVGWPGREYLDQHAKDAVAIIEKYVAAKGGA